MIGLFILGALVLYLAFAVWIVKRQKTKKAKWIAIIVLALIPTWDEIVGRAYFHYLCVTEGGIRAYKTVELPAEYWAADGGPRFITPKGQPDKTLLGERYGFSREFDENFSKIFGIKKYVNRVTDEQNGEILGEYNSFIYFRGWVASRMGAHITGIPCPSAEEYSYRSFLMQLFKQKPGLK